MKIIELDKNIGFANGNNIGCEYAYKTYNSDFYIVINNDTIIEDRLFVDKIIDIYKETHFDVLGPCIWSIVDEVDQNPVPYPTDSLKKSFKALLYNIALFVLNFVNKDTALIRFVDGKRSKRTKNNTVLGGRTESEKGIKLHGAAVIFSNKYYSKYKSAFDPRTFMYCEEDILYSRIKNDKLVSIYNSTLKILHKEDVASNAVMSNGQLRRRFKFKHSIWSSFVLLRIYMHSWFRSLRSRY